MERNVENVRHCISPSHRVATEGNNIGGRFLGCQYEVRDYCICFLCCMRCSFSVNLSVYYMYRISHMCSGLIENGV